jgi:hypothetical protein
MERKYKDLKEKNRLLILEKQDAQRVGILLLCCVGYAICIGITIYYGSRIGCSIVEPSSNMTTTDDFWQCYCNDINR